MSVPAPPSWLDQFRDKSLDEAATAGIVAFARPPFISIDKNRFSLVDAQGNRETLRDLDIEVIVVGTNKGLSKLYYGHAYDPSADEHEPPKCYSDNGIGPSQNSMEPQNPTCQGCPQNVWGSDTSNISGKSIKACSDRKKLAVLYDGDLYQLVIPPASLKQWQKYADFVAKHPSISINIIRTQIKFDDKVQGVLNFQAMGFAGDFSQQAQIAGATDQQGVIEFMTKLKGEGPKMLDFFTGNDDKPKAGIALPRPTEVPAALPNGSGNGAFAGPPAPRNPPQVHTLPPQQGAWDPTQAAQAVAAQEQERQGMRQLPPQGQGGFMGGAAAPPAAPKRGRPPKNNGSAQAQGFSQQMQQAQPQAQSQAFGMVETPQVDDPELDASISNAMNFMQGQ